MQPLLPLTAHEWLQLGSFITRLGPTLCGQVDFAKELERTVSA